MFAVVNSLHDLLVHMNFRYVCLLEDEIFPKPQLVVQPLQH